MMKGIIITNPNKIPKDDLPLIVLSTHSSGFIAMWIRWRTKAYYSHGMSMIQPGEFASQGNTFSVVPVSRYMTRNSRLKFWRIKDLKEWEKNKILSRINKRLNFPWWKRGYDHIGIIGQALGLKFINNPWRVYCSEQVKADWLDDIIGLLADLGIDATELPNHPSPKDLNEFFKNYPRFEVYGRWSSD